MIQGNNIRIFATIILLVIGGGYLLLNRENAISLFLGLGLFGIAAACVPIMFIKILGSTWTIVLSYLILGIVLAALTIYERREVKKKSASDEKEAEDHEG